MDKDQNQVLQRAWFKLVNEIADIHSVVHCLYAKEALTTNLRDNILQRDDTRQGRVANLLSILQRKSDGFEKLYDALVECDEPTAKLLIPGLRGTRSGAGPKDCVHGSPPQLDSVTLPSTWPDNTVHTADNVEVVRVSKDNQFMRAQFQAATDPHRSPDAITPYPLQQEFRGIFLLINNKDFSKAREEGRQMKDRLGTEKDMTALQKLFGGLWFKVQIKPDRTAAEMAADIKEQFEADHTEYDCFGCAILSHGGRDVIYGVDGSSLPLNTIYDIALKTACPSLVGKPKLFFIQACQGDVADKGVSVPDGPGGDAVDEDLARHLGENLQLHDEEKRSFREHNEEPRGQTPPGPQREETDGGSTPSGSDFFLAVATISGFQSLRNTVHGSWFMQTLAYIFSRYAHLFDINDLMILVNRLVSKATTVEGERQQPVFTPAAFNRKFYFFPGLTCPRVRS